MFIFYANTYINQNIKQKLQTISFLDIIWALGLTIHIFFLWTTLSVSKVSSSKFCLYLFQIVFRPKFSPYSQQSSTISSNSYSKGCFLPLLTAYWSLSYFHFDLRNAPTSSSEGRYELLLLSLAPIFFITCFIFINGNFDSTKFFSKEPPRFFSGLLFSDASWFACEFVYLRS